MLLLILLQKGGFNMDNIIGERIHSLRLEKKMSQKDFAAFLGINQPMLSSYEKGRVIPSLDIIKKMATLCHVSLDWLCGIASDSISFSNVGEIITFISALNKIDNSHMEIQIDKIMHKISLSYKCDDPDNIMNSAIYNALRDFKTEKDDLEAYMINQDSFEKNLERLSDYYSNIPVFERKTESLDSDMLIKKRLELLNSK